MRDIGYYDQIPTSGHSVDSRDSFDKASTKIFKLYNYHPGEIELPPGLRKKLTQFFRPDVLNLSSKLGATLSWAGRYAA